MQRILENIYQIPVPLPNNPLKELNTYLVRGERDLLIDTGFDLDTCEQALRAAFAGLGVKEDKLDIFITHFHSDHVGLLHRLVTPETKVLGGKIPWEILGARDRDRWQQRYQRLKSFGLKEIDPEWKPQTRPEFSVEWIKVQNIEEVQNGKVIPVGNYRLQCIETNGHLPGHICLYEPTHKILFSGDHLLDKISPNVACYNMDNSSSLSEYLENLDKTAELDIRLVLPGHRNIFSDPKRRIEELKAHHRERLAEVARIVNNKKQTGVEIASQMKWKLSYSDWEEFPLTQKFFALGEAMAHLNYFVEKGIIKMESHNGLFYFSKE